MSATIGILFDLPMWLWLLYHIIIGILIVIDLWIRRTKEMDFKESVIWSVIWISVGLAFGVMILILGGLEAAGLYYTAFVIEKMLSMDNLFVFAVIFSYFKVPFIAQPFVLYVGIVTAAIMRGAFIYGGIWLIERFYWSVFIFGAVLFVSGIRLLKGPHDRVNPERNPVVRLAKRFLPLADYYDGYKFIIRPQDRGTVLFTPLIICLIAIEMTDIIFAFDSVPVAIAITLNFAIAYTSNISAVLGLRSLYFL
ncbi:MAG: TerC/Alx family metal homeostasis membrane protein, partial [Nitrososphaerota archaeon]